jgi:hypothetical protein
MIQFEVIGYRGVDYARGEETIDSEAEVLESMFRVKKGLEENDIKIEEKAGRIEISCYTLMHNDYSDMPNIMKSIYFALLENLPGNVIFRRQDD